MFSKEKTTPTVQNEVDPNARNQIAAGTSIVGEIKSDGVFRIDGSLKGNLTTKGKLVVGNSGSIQGEVTAKSAEIYGAIEGKLYVEDMLILRSTAKVSGDVRTSKLSIEPGAVFSVTCDMSGGGTSNMQKNAKQNERQSTK